MSEFWSSKRVLITGATGFIGSWLTEELSKNEADITVLLNNDSFEKYSIKHLNNIDFIKASIEDTDLIEPITKDFDIVFHLAAITQVLYSIKHPKKTFSVNFGGTLNILESIRKSNTTPFLVFVSTDKVYGEPKYLPIDENHPLSSKSPYDASKVAADRAVYSYHKTYGIKSTILRWSNAYGGRDANILRAVPDFVNSVINKNNPVIRGNGKHIRDYMYVSDIINALTLSAEKNRKTDGEELNFGTEAPTSVIELAEKIIQLSGLELRPEILGKETPGEIDIQYLTNKKAKKILDWEPKICLEDGLKKTIEWYRNNTWWKEVSNKVGMEFGV